MCILGLVGILACGYGYAALSTDLLIEGDATMLAEQEIRNVGVQLVSYSGTSQDTYNSDFSAKSVSLYPMAGASGGTLGYHLTTCNQSKDKTYELVGIKYPIKTLPAMTMQIYSIEAGTESKYGTMVAPGQCVTTGIVFTSTAASTDVGSVQMDYEWREYQEPTGEFPVEYMQDLTPDVCLREVKVGATKQLIDKRDGKKYWVEKLADGNCWMQQNLALDLKGANQTLTPDTSDVSAPWTATTATDAKVLDGTPDYDASVAANNTQYSWSMGQMIAPATAQPVVNVYCYSTNYYQPGANMYATAKSTDDLGQICSGWGLTNVAGWTPGFKKYQGTFMTKSGVVFNGTVTLDETAKTYDEHYLLGNYYQWNTATAGSGEAVLTHGEYAPDSICPKGWKLPANGQDDGSFMYLLMQYGFSTGNKGQLTGGYGIVSDYQQWPLYMTRAGMTAPYYGYLMYTGQQGLYWTSMSAVYQGTPGVTAYASYFNFDGIYPYGDTFYRFFGASVRCVMR